MTDPAKDAPAGRAVAGTLAADLLRHAGELARGGGPTAITIRDVQRRAGVSHNAAYRYFPDRAALVAAVAGQASRALADAMHDASDDVDGADPVDTARARVRALCRAYVTFAMSEPGLFATLSAVPDGVDPMAVADAMGRGAAGTTPFEQLTGALDALVTVGALSSERRTNVDVAVWSAVHGLALLLHGQLSVLGPEERAAVTERTLDLIQDGLDHPR